MQVLTANQVRQIRLTASAAYEALEIIDTEVCHTIDRLLCIVTSERAIAAYKATAKIAYHTVMMACACAFYSGVLARHGWNAFRVWADEFVASCEAYHPVEVIEYSVTEEEVAIAHPEPVEDVWEGEVTVQPLAVTSVTPVKPILMLPPAKIEATVEAPVVGKKRRGGRTKKAVA